MTTTDKQRDDMRTYLLSTRDYWGQYRTLKENYLWIATTVYVGALVALVRFRIDPAYTIALSLKIGIALLVAALFVLIVMFMKKLNEDRSYASDVTTACEALLVRLLDPAFRLQPNLKLTDTYQKAKDLPEYLSNLVDKLGAPSWTFKDERNQWNLKAPRRLVILATIAAELLIVFG